MQVTIHVDTAQPLSEQDKSVLSALAFGGDDADAPTPAESAPPALAIVPDAEEKPKRTRRTKAQIEADNAAATAGDGEAASDGDGEPTLKDVLDAASLLLKDGKEDQVRAALASVGAAKVSEIADENRAAFLVALADE